VSNLELLKEACRIHGQRGVARILNRSPTAINHVLNGKYPNPSPILEMAGLAFGGVRYGVVKCPVLGEIHAKTCGKYKQLAEANKVTADRLYMEVKHVCNGCTRGEV